MSALALDKSYLAEEFFLSGEVTPGKMFFWRDKNGICKMQCLEQHSDGHKVKVLHGWKLTEKGTWTDWLDMAGSVFVASIAASGTCAWELEPLKG